MATVLTTKQFRKIVREEAAKVFGASITYSYTDKKSAASDDRACAMRLKGMADVRNDVFVAVRRRVADMGSDQMPTLSLRWIRMTHLRLDKE